MTHGDDGDGSASGYGGGTDACGGGNNDRDVLVPMVITVD